MFFEHLLKFLNFKFTMDAPIWKIRLFEYSKALKQAVCKPCRETGEKKFTFSVNNWATSSVIYHLHAKHKGSEFEQLYAELENKRKLSAEKNQMVKFVVVKG